MADTNDTLASKEKLVSDMKIVIADTEEILRATASHAGEKVGELRERIQERLRDAKVRLQDAEAALLRELREEIGLEPGDVDVAGSTDHWLRYRVPA